MGEVSALGLFVVACVRADVFRGRGSLTSERRRSERSGWYVRASRVRGRNLSTRRAILSSVGMSRELGSV
jgi:hypothetical protein